MKKFLIIGTIILSLIVIFLAGFKISLAVTYGSNIFNPSGVCEDTGEIGTPYTCKEAIDENLNTNFQSNTELPDYLIYDLGATTTKCAAKSNTRFYTDAWEKMGKDYGIYGSSNKADWTELATGQASNSTSQSDEFLTWTPLTNFRYYKINITSAWRDPFTGVVEWRLYEDLDALPCEEEEEEGVATTTSREVLTASLFFHIDAIFFLIVLLLVYGIIIRPLIKS